MSQLKTAQDENLPIWLLRQAESDRNRPGFTDELHPLVEALRAELLATCAEVRLTILTGVH
jgi:hypothetical protein